MSFLKMANFVIVIVACILFSFWMGMRLYKKNRSNLDAHINARKVYPQKIRFAFAWIIYSLLNCLPFIPIFWLLERNHPAYPLVGLLLVYVSMTFSVYPYYTLSRDDEKITGATLWSLMWRREEIKLSEIDQEGIWRRNFGNLLGITILFSTQGKKILTLGLSRLQILEVLESEKDNSRI